MKWLTDALLAKILLIGSVVLLALVPFHAFMTVWVASFGVNYTLVRLWKEVLLFGLFAVAVIFYIRSADLRSCLFGRKLVRYLALAILGYALLQLLSGVLALQFGTVSLTAFGYSLISNLRFLAFFAIAMVVGT